MVKFDFWQFLLNNGIGLTLAVVLLIRMFKREDRREKEVAELHKFQRETLLTLVADNREQIAENTNVLNQLKAK